MFDEFHERRATALGNMARPSRDRVLDSSALALARTAGVATRRRRQSCRRDEKSYLAVLRWMHATSNPAK